MKNKNSFLISFEGIEGSGKTTQIELLKSDLVGQGYDVHLLREPGGTQFGEGLRKVILESSTPINPLSEALLFASSRAQLLTEKILPLLARERTIVILDRYLDSSVAYQGFARELGAKLILDLHSAHPLNTRPDLTIYLKIDIETSMQRQDKRGMDKDYFEKESSAFYQKLINGYNYCADSFPDRIKTVDAMTSIDKITKAISQEVRNLIK